MTGYYIALHKQSVADGSSSCQIDIGVIPLNLRGHEVIEHPQVCAYDHSKPKLNGEKSHLLLPGIIHTGIATSHLDAHVVIGNSHEYGLSAAGRGKRGKISGIEIYHSFFFSAHGISAEVTAVLKHSTYMTGEGQEVVILASVAVQGLALDRPRAEKV